MLYRKNKKGEELSILGFGCMRLPTKAGLIDFNRAQAQIRYAYEHGVNYFDTAYIYHAGQSEGFLGKALKGIREEVNVATKLPPYLVKKPEDINKIFGTQLKRLQTDYVDYYLMHALKDLSTWEGLVENGILKFIDEAKEKGTIRNIGFSFHGNSNEFVRIIDAYDWDFCQIQWNYTDEFTQAGTGGLEYAHSKGIPVIIMEPLLGGHLANKLAEDEQKVFDNASVKRSNAEWGLRWVWNNPAVTVVLSGMGEEAHVEENIRTADEGLPNSMTKEELKVVDDVCAAIKKKRRIPCTGCGYCMPCPAGVDIPECFDNFNTIYSVSKGRAMSRYIGFTSGLTGGVASNAGKCVKCGKCAKHCPQSIEIPDRIEDVRQEFEGLVFKAAMLMKKGMKIGKNDKREA
ncbi:MAG: aldo/keto reductase [Clostridiales bacterium]|jgi:predicted aldo/keto reductase-like oxidoreductase|nr:aldo/keto reductase [Clostridiales bacterium]